MSQAEVRSMIEQFAAWVDEGYTLLSWNGARLRLQRSGRGVGPDGGMRTHRPRPCGHDVHVVCALGYPVALGKAAEGLGLPGKSGGISGCDAPVMWAQGRFAEVLEYNTQDSRLALAIALEAERRGELLWITPQGHHGAHAAEARLGIPFGRRCRFPGRIRPG